ncbi:MAG TPA: replication initiation regulator SeqA, partial [Pseudoalteromonas sp.]|nr:replication initiation regulator SeqA [Pseudoalteromonas sp.]
MKQIDIDDELYQYIASNTQSIGESASTILRRLLNLNGDD